MTGVSLSYGREGSPWHQRLSPSTSCYIGNSGDSQDLFMQMWKHDHAM
jgi:hypothetical protein